ncbi:hypothetical protein ACF0H5_016875 [Mactra antiquata]
MSSTPGAARKKRVQYKPEQMAIAISAVKAGMVKKAAAKLYQVPKTTLLDKVSGRVPEQPTKPDPKKKKVAERMREKIPKALSGKEALRMLREKKAQRETAEKAKKKGNEIGS